MTLEKYRKVLLAVALVTSAIFSYALLRSNWFIPLIVLIAVSILVFYLRRKVDDVIADERDYAIGGKAAYLAMQIYLWTAMIVMFVFYSSRGINPAYEPIAVTLAFSACFLMLAYVFIFHFYNRINFSNKKFIYSIIIIIFLAGIFVVGARFLSGEDDWICQNGQWTKHGNPSFPAPSVECK